MLPDIVFVNFDNNNVVVTLLHLHMVIGLLRKATLR